MRVRCRQPGEWWYDEATQELFLWPNSTSPDGVAAPPLEELPTEALERELHRRRSVSPRPAADQSNGLSDESDGADSMSDDASFIHGDDDLDSNGTLSPIPSRSTTPVFYDAAVDPSTPRSLTPILYESVLDPEATPTHFRPVVPSASARLLDFLASPFQ